MKTVRNWVVCLGLMLAMVSGAQAIPPLPLMATSGPAIYMPGGAGMPPALRNPDLVPHARQMEVKYFRYGPTNQPVVFAQAWYPDNYYPQYVDRQTTAYYLKSPTGPGGYRMFPAGTYGVQWRGYNAHGYGPWSTTTPFQVTHPAMGTTVITSGPRTVKSGTDMTYRWKNNFAPSAHQVQIQRNGRLLLTTNRPGVFQAGWITSDTSYYSHRPASPARELPNGTGYSIRVRSYSPVLSRWTTWSSRLFRMSRGAVSVPRLYYSSKDYNNFFNRSPRPFFGANYGTSRLPSLWTYLEIRRKAGSRWPLLSRQWVSRYPHCAGSAGGPVSGVTGGKVWVGGAYAYPDLQPGTYKWRARAWNGTGAGQSRWTTWTTTRVQQAGSLWKPPTNGFGFYPYNNASHFAWRSVPNAYNYNLTIYRNGAWYRNVRNLDPRANAEVYINGSATGGPATVYYNGPGLTTGVYRFKYQAVAYSGPTGGFASAWSDLTPSYTVP